MHAGINHFCQPKTVLMNILKCYLLIMDKRPTICTVIFLSLYWHYDEILSVVMEFTAILGENIFFFGNKW